MKLHIEFDTERPDELSLHADGEPIEHITWLALSDSKFGIELAIKQTLTSGGVLSDSSFHWYDKRIHGYLRDAKGQIIQIAKAL